MDDLEIYMDLILGHRPVGTVVGQLSVYELAALLEFAGYCAGFEVKPEKRVPIVYPEFEGLQTNGEIDCAWIRPGHPAEIVVAWEIDAINVPDIHLSGSTVFVDKLKAGNLRKLRASAAPIRVQALYSYRPNVNMTNRHARVAKFYGDAVPPIEVHVLADVDLLQGKLIEIANTAIALL